MAKGRSRLKRVSVVDGPTPERMSRDQWGMVEAPEGGVNKRLINVHKVVVSGSIDHLYHLGALNFWQWHAGCKYREMMQDGWPQPRIVGGYEPAIGGSADPSPVPLNDKAERARATLKTLRSNLSLPQRQIIEEALSHEHEKERGRRRKEWLDHLRGSLTQAAIALGITNA